MGVGQYLWFHQHNKLDIPFEGLYQILYEYLFEKWYVGEKTKKELENFDIDKEFKRIKTNESEISISVNSLFDKWIAS